MKDYLKFEQKPKLVSKKDIATLSRHNAELTEHNFRLFKELIFDSIQSDVPSSSNEKYTVKTYRLTNSNMPSIEVCIENLSKYTKHAKSERIKCFVYSGYHKNTQNNGDKKN